MAKSDITIGPVKSSEDGSHMIPDGQTKKKKRSRGLKVDTETFIVRADVKIGSDPQGNVRYNLKRGQSIELTADKAENYKKHKIIL